MSLNITLKDIRHNQLLKIFFMSNALPKKISFYDRLLYW